MGIDDLAGGPQRGRRREQRPPMRGRISKAPASVDDGLEVVGIRFSQVAPYEVPKTNWMPRVDGEGTIVLPVEGMKCVIVFDDYGDAWVQVYG